MGTLSTLSSILLLLVISYHQAEAERGKTRSLSLAIKEVNEIKEALVNESENGTLQWKPSYKNKFALVDASEFTFGILPTPESKVRAFQRKPPVNRIPPLKPGQTRPESLPRRLPRRYNAREVYGKKCPSFNQVMRQVKECNNCWAVATTAMINDRVCMYQRAGRTQKFYSAKHMTTCQQKGCAGGWCADALQFWITDGLVSGGDDAIGQPRGCKPAPQITPEIKNEKCRPTCDDGSPIRDGEKSFGGKRYEIRSKSAKEIMEEIYLYGPVVAVFDVYEDLIRYYDKGPYKHVHGSLMAPHAVKLYGWGEENGVPFWYAANSWGKGWGADDGFFKIQRGNNECNIEAEIHAAIPPEGLLSF